MVLGPLVACAPPQDPHSDLSQLTEMNYTCWDPTPNRLQEVEDKLPQGFLTRFPDKKGLKRLAGLPDPYLDYLIDLYDQGTFRGITYESAGFGAGGVTMLGGSRARGMTPLYIKITPGFTNAALQHEVGHAVDSLVKRESGNAGMFDNIYNSIRKNSLFRSYAKSQPAEGFAELFNSYYCSEKSWNMVKDNFSSEQFAFLEKAFDPPPWKDADQDDDGPLTSGPVDPGSSTPGWPGSSGGMGTGQAPLPEGDPINVLVVKQPDATYTVYAATPTWISWVNTCTASTGCGNRIQPIKRDSSRNFYFVGNGHTFTEALEIKAHNLSGAAVSRRSIEANDLLKMAGN